MIEPHPHRLPPSIMCKQQCDSRHSLVFFSLLSKYQKTSTTRYTYVSIFIRFILLSLWCVCVRSFFHSRSFSLSMFCLFAHELWPPFVSLNRNMNSFWFVAAAWFLCFSLLSLTFMCVCVLCVCLCSFKRECSCHFDIFIYMMETMYISCVYCSLHSFLQRCPLFD